MNDFAIHHVPDRQLNPPEYGEWTESDMADAVDRLVDRLERGESWDENFDYRGDMCIEIEAVLLTYGTTRMTCEEAMSEIRAAQSKYMVMWAKRRVEDDPDKYCEETDDEF
jgi:hypothetical protein